MLVIDEADRILDLGFEEDMRAIIKALPTDRQTALFSATQTKNVQDLARLSIRVRVVCDASSQLQPFVWVLTDGVVAAEYACVRWRRGPGPAGHCGFLDARLRGVPERPAVLAAVHLPQEVPQEEEDHGVLQLLQLGEVPLGAVELRGYAGIGHPRQVQAGQAHGHLLRVLQRQGS